jgi:hypothetical protein
LETPITNGIAIACGYEKTARGPFLGQAVENLTILDGTVCTAHNSKRRVGGNLARPRPVFWLALRMAEFLGSPHATIVFLLALTATLIAGGIYVIGRVRAGINAKEPPANEWLTKFKELHAKGELSDEEYRTIKAMLAERLQRELNSTDEPR